MPFGCKAKRLIRGRHRPLTPTSNSQPIHPGRAQAPADFLLPKPNTRYAQIFIELPQRPHTKDKWSTTQSARLSIYPYHRRRWVAHSTLHTLGILVFFFGKFWFRPMQCEKFLGVERRPNYAAEFLRTFLGREQCVQHIVEELIDNAVASEMFCAVFDHARWGILWRMWKRRFVQWLRMCAGDEEIALKIVSEALALVYKAICSAN